MSFSFRVVARSGIEALGQVSEKLAAVVEAQPVHQADRDLVFATASQYVSFAGEPTEGNVLVVNVGGSIWFRDGVLGGASVNVQVGFEAAPAA